jgi:hypothetical protein
LICGEAEVRSRRDQEAWQFTSADPPPSERDTGILEELPMVARNLPRLVTLAAALMLCVGIAGTAFASIPVYRVKVPVPAGLNPDDAHLIFAGTGGTLAKPVLVRPAGSASVGGAGNQIDVTLDLKASPGDTVEVTFISDHHPVVFLSGTWTNGGNTIGTVLGSSVIMLVPAPGVSTALLVVLAVMMLGLGAFAIRRREQLA